MENYTYLCITETLKTIRDMKKNNTFKFWVLNRFTYLMLMWVCMFVLMLIVDDPYFNIFVLGVCGFLSLCLWAYLMEDNHANSSERLMWQKYSTFVDSCFEIC